MAEFRIVGSAADVAREAAALVRERLRSGARNLVLAGGSTPLRAYRELAGERVEWGRVNVLFGDERCVPPDDVDSNFRAAREVLLDRVAPGVVNRIPAELGPELGARLYSEVLERAGPLDLVLLGVGTDGHTASLFPGHAALTATTPAVAVTGAPKPPADRVSLSLVALQAAREILVLATGADKAAAVRAARVQQVPAGMLDQATWLLDEAAGS